MRGIEMAKNYLEEKYGGGDTKVYYMKDPSCVIDVYMDGCEVDADNIEKTHTLLGTVPFQDVDDVFHKMQGEQWSPEGRGNNLIEQKGLRHTSMSVGDIVELSDGERFMVKPIGWERIGD